MHVLMYAYMHTHTHMHVLMYAYMHIQHCAIIIDTLTQLIHTDVHVSNSHSYLAVKHIHTGCQFLLLGTVVDLRKTWLGTSPQI